MTLLEKMAEAIREQRDLSEYEWPMAAARAALRTILTPTVGMVNRGGLYGFAGPQTEGEPLKFYPALVWREMLNFVLEERDHERDYGDDAAGAERAPEGGPEPDLLQGHPDHGGGEPADGQAAGDEGRGDGAEG